MQVKAVRMPLKVTVDATLDLWRTNDSILQLFTVSVLAPLGGVCEAYYRLLACGAMIKQSDVSEVEHAVDIFIVKKK
jgi:hypothetical protein